MICLSDDVAASADGAAMRQVFGAKASVAHIMAFEAALAQAQARRGMIPEAAATDIAGKATLDHFDQGLWANQRAALGHPLVSVLETWTTRLEPASREWLHYGATTADLFNTVLVLQLQAAGQLMLARMAKVESRLVALATAHRSTPMVARTLGRHAQPITFGMKVATLLAEHRRSMERLAGWLQRYRTGILSGAVGTYAALGKEGPAIEREVMAALRLGPPEAVDWKGSRDRFAEFGCAVALAARTCGHIGQEVFLLSGDDIDELREGTVAVGSSTMPHKSNPVLSIDIVSRSREVSARLAPLMEWVLIVYDRDSAQHGDVLRDLCVGMADLLSNLDHLLAGLVVLPQNMTANLQRSGGMVLSEALTFALAQRVGKRTAYAAMKRVMQAASEQACTLAEAAARSPEFSALLAEHPDLLDEARQVGRAPSIVDAAVASMCANAA